MMIDAHTHWNADFSDPDDPLNPEKWLSHLDASGITHAVVLPLRGLLSGKWICEDNDAVATACAASQGRMIPLCSVNIYEKQAALDEFERCLKTGAFKGIKFHPWLQGASVNDPAMDAICEMAAAWEVPVFFHDGTPPFSLPSQMAMLARRHPHTRIVLGHCGILEFWREAIAAMNAAPNIWGVLSGPHLAAMREILRSVPTERLCWGSDFGFGPNPIPYRAALVDRLGLSPAQRQAILAENPSRLFRVG